MVLNCENSTVQDENEKIEAAARKNSRDVCSLVERLMKAMEKSTGSKITLDQLCITASVSKSTLQRVFVQEKNLSPLRCLESIRIEKAREQLKNQEEISKVALDCGFCDQSHFHRCFLKITGLTPGLYRSIFGCSSQ